jgi:putative tryptophan/tyrosine transport system substrate-binding protein
VPLRNLGWRVGHDLVLEPRFAEGQLDRLPALAHDLVSLNVDVIAAFGPLPIKPARDATRTIPIVMIAVGDPVGQGLVASLSRPGGNITGVAWGASSDEIGKTLEILKEAIPKAIVVGILGEGPGTAEGNRAFENAARRLGFKPAPPVAVGDATELEPAIAAISRKGIDAVYVPMRGFLFNDRHRVAALAVARRLPTFSGLRELPEAGGFFSYGHSLADLYRRAATFVDRILKGARPGDIPIEQATKFELVINLKTAKALGLTIPPSLLLRADQVIE